MKYAHPGAMAALGFGEEQGPRRSSSEVIRAEA